MQCVQARAASPASSPPTNTGIMDMRAALLSVAGAVVWTARSSPAAPPTAASPTSRTRAGSTPSPTKHPASSPPVKARSFSVLELFPSAVLNQCVAVSQHIGTFENLSIRIVELTRELFPAVITRHRLLSYTRTMYGAPNQSKLKFFDSVLWIVVYPRMAIKIRACTPTMMILLPSGLQPTQTSHHCFPHREPPGLLSRHGRRPDHGYWTNHRLLHDSFGERRCAVTDTFPDTLSADRNETSPWELACSFGPLVVHINYICERCCCGLHTTAWKHRIFSRPAIFRPPLTCVSGRLCAEACTGSTYYGVQYGRQVCERRDTLSRDLDIFCCGCEVRHTKAPESG